MPAMSAPAFGACLGALYPGTPVLFMSGYAQEEIVGQGLLEAHYPLLRKPFSPAALAAAITSVLDVKAPRA